MGNYTQRKLTSLTLFFPFYNDEGTVLKQIGDAYRYGREVAKEIEVIAIHGGPSKDRTWDKILEAKKLYPSLQIIDKHDNTIGYAVIRHGLLQAKKEWIFYTDGDRQYHVSQLTELVKKYRKTGVDVINGYKIKRYDHWHRKIFGSCYAYLSCLLLGTHLRDPHCDFRLIKRSLMTDYQPRLPGAGVIDELLMYLKKKKALFAEVPVIHYDRSYGKSNFNVLKLTIESLRGIIQLLVP